MKNLAALMMAILVVTPVSTSFAQAQPQPQITPSLGLPDLKGTIGIQAGTYEFYDPTKSQMAIIEEVRERSAKDLEFYLDWVNKRNQDWNEIIRLVHGASNSLQEMSDNSWAGVGAVDHVKFLEKAREFRQRSEDFLNAVNSFEATSAAFAPSGKALNQNPANRAIFDNIQQRMNFAAQEPAAKYREQLTRLTDTAKNLPYKVKYKNGLITEIQPNSGQGLELRAAYAIYSPDEINQMQEQVYRWQNLNRDQKEIVNAYNTYVRMLITGFINKYGKGDRFTFRNDIDMKAFTDTLGEIVQAFWAKDLLRAMGIPMGAIYATYDKMWFELDRFKSARNIVEFQQQQAWERKELNDLRKNYVEALQTARDKKLRLTQSGKKEELEQFGLLHSAIGVPGDDPSEQIQNDDVQVFAYANSFITMMMGSRAVADAYYWLLYMLLADLESELNFRTKGQSGAMKRYQQAWLIPGTTRRDQAIEWRETFWPKNPTATPGGERPSRKPGQGGVAAGDGDLTGQMKILRRLHTAKQMELNLAFEQELMIQNAVLIGNKGNDINNDEIDELEKPVTPEKK